MKAFVVMLVLTPAILLGCGKQEIDARLSAIVSVVTDADGADAWLRDSGLSRVEAWVRFPADLPDDVIFGIDQELLEGKPDPIHFPGADWMALLGVQRTGVAWVGAGKPAQLGGEPSKDRDWKIHELGAALQPDTWYRMEVVADFRAREFVSFTVEGPGLDKTLDLKGIQVDYPNYIPFDGRAVTFYVFAMRGRSLAQDGLDSPAAVCFDDVQGGHLSDDGALTVTLSDDFEDEAGAIASQDIPLSAWLGGTIPLANYAQGEWYLEREEALARAVEVDFAHSGRTVVECSATLQDVAYDDWLAQHGEIVDE